MNVLRPGYIPDGWSPGDGVHVIPARPGEPGAIVHAPQGLERAIIGEHEPGDVAMVKFDYEDTPDVGHWLAWWSASGR